MLAAEIGTTAIVGVGIAVVVVLGILAFVVGSVRSTTGGRAALDRDVVEREKQRERLEKAKAAALARTEPETEDLVDVDGEIMLAEPETTQALAAPSDEQLDVYAPEDVPPPDPVEVGIGRRQVLNRMMLVGSGAALLPLAGGALAFLIPAPAKGFGGIIEIQTSIDDIKADIDQNKRPFYSSEARSYLVTYEPKDDAIAEATYAPIWSGVKESGLMPLFQKCPHLGCKVPWCDTSQWFECPCHGTQYNAAGEKQVGPAPRGMDRFEFEVRGNKIAINTGKPVEGPPIGTDTTSQQPAGPSCVG
jgi:cytochrome b6-f complex iron-sulfur subunit